MQAQRGVWVGLLLLAAGAVAVAVAGEALGTYQGRQIAPTMHASGADWLTRSSRGQEEAPARLLASLPLSPGQTACDVGAGSGYHALMLASVVGETGKVYAVDVQAEMLALLRERAAAAGVENIVSVLGAVDAPNLPAGVCDVLLLVDVYHEFAQPEAMLRGLRAALSPAGMLVLVEFRAEDPSLPIRRLHTMSKEQIMRELPLNGLKLVGQVDDLPWQHVLFFQRDDGPAPAVAPLPWSPQK